MKELNGDFKSTAEHGYVQTVTESTPASKEGRNFWRTLTAFLATNRAGQLAVIQEYVRILISPNY